MGPSTTFYLEVSPPGKCLWFFLMIWYLQWRKLAFGQARLGKRRVSATGGNTMPRKTIGTAITQLSLTRNMNHCACMGMTHVWPKREMRKWFASPWVTALTHARTLWWLPGLCACFDVFLELINICNQYGETAVDKRPRHPNKSKAISTGYKTLQAYMAPVTWAQVHVYLVWSSIPIVWTPTCKTKITVSLNILFYGFQPERPLTCHIKDAGDAPINPRFCPQLSDKPVAVVDGRVLFCMLGEIKADWKFHKDRFCWWI